MFQTTNQLSIDLPLGFLTLEQSNTDNLKSPKAARSRTSWQLQRIHHN